MFPGEDNGIIYIAATDSVKIICHAREVFPGRGFSWGASVAKKRGLEIFWGKCLSDFLHGIVFPGELNYVANAYSHACKYLPRGC